MAVRERAAHAADRSARFGTGAGVVAAVVLALLVARVGHYAGCGWIVSVAVVVGLLLPGLVVAAMALEALYDVFWLCDVFLWMFGLER